MLGIRTTRSPIAALAAGLFTAVCFVGCGETTESKTKVEQSTPGGKTETEVREKVTQSGQNPPPPAETTTPPK